MYFTEPIITTYCGCVELSPHLTKEYDFDCSSLIKSYSCNILFHWSILLAVPNQSSLRRCPDPKLGHFQNPPATQSLKETVL